MSFSDRLKLLLRFLGLGPVPISDIDHNLQGQNLLGQVNLKNCYVLLTDDKIVEKPNCLHILFSKGNSMRSIYVCANSVRVSYPLSSVLLFSVRFVFGCFDRVFGFFCRSSHFYSGPIEGRLYQVRFVHVFFLYAEKLCPNFNSSFKTSL